jgi:TetR/AcrR family fatty acid metabolism transcriptional regulator
MLTHSKTPGGDKHQRIILAAMAVFSRKGFHKAKIEEIAEKAEIGKGTVYEYFASKKELFLEMLIYAHELYQERLEHELSQAATIEDGLHRLFIFATQFMQEHKEMALILLADHPLAGEDFYEILLRKEQRQFDALSAMVQNLFRQKGAGVRLRADVNINAASLTIIGALYAVCSQIIFPAYDGEEIDIEKLVRDSIDILLRGLAAF